MQLTRRTAWSLVFLVIPVSFGCKTSQSNPGTSNTLSTEDETPLPEYTPKYLDLDAQSPGATSEEMKANDPSQSASGDLQLAEGAGTKRYFYTVYSFQGTGPFNLPRFTHTWAVFAKLEGTKLDTDPLKHFTISWDAADGVIGIAQPDKPGHNYSLEATYRLRDNLNVDTSVRRSRMVEISRRLFEAAYQQYSKINAGEVSGRIRYKMLDDMDGRQMVKRGQAGGYMNCQHAVADILARPDGSLVDSGIARGFAAGDLIFDWFRNSYVSTDPRMEKIAQRLHLQTAAN